MRLTWGDIAVVAILNGWVCNYCVRLFFNTVYCCYFNELFRMSKFRCLLFQVDKHNTNNWRITWAPTKTHSLQKYQQKLFLLCTQKRSLSGIWQKQKINISKSQSSNLSEVLIKTFLIPNTLHIFNKTNIFNVIYSIE